MKPDYQGSRDEIVRMTIENDFTRKIMLKKCVCGQIPKEKFYGCTEYFISCPRCGMKTECHRHLYEAKIEWNKKNQSIVK